MKVADTLEEGMRTEILNGPLAEIVEDRVHWMQAPQTSKIPYILLGTASTTEIGSLSGSSGLCRTLIQVDAYAATYDEAKRLIEIIRDSVGDNRSSLGGYAVQGVTVANLRDGLVRPQEGAGQGKFRRTCDVRVWHNVRRPGAA